MESVASAQSASIALKIAGSDSGANAGIPADLKTFAANDAYGTSATAPTPNGVTAIHPIPPESVVFQIEQIAAFYYPKSIKKHGSGFTLRAAITAWLSKGFGIQDSVLKGLNLIRSTMEFPVTIKGIRFVNHFP